ncbi:MAG: PHP domain-containing protein [Gemmatimonadaceae bacterium]
MKSGPQLDAPAVRSEIDLHLHSTASDGILPPAQVVEAARVAGLSTIALTDHDTVAGVEEAVRAGADAGVRVIRGVELSAHEGERGREVHVLGLHVTRLDALERELSALREKRMERARLIVARLNEIGVGISLGDVLAQADGGAVGRPHIARAMIRSGAVADQREAFDRYLGQGRAAFIPKSLFLVEDAIRIIHAADGIAIWAHPSHTGTRERIEKLVAKGLDGVEVRHPSHSPDVAASLEALCDFLGLVPSGGSDWHGPVGDRMLGGQFIPREWLERQERLVASRVPASTAH